MVGLAIVERTKVSPYAIVLRLQSDGRLKFRTNISNREA